MKNETINLFENKIIPNTGVKYSVLFEQFIAKFENEFLNMQNIEEVFKFAISAWNFGNMKVIMTEDEFDKVTGLTQEKDADSVLILKMINYKVSEFKKYTNFIVDFDITETSAGPLLKIITEEEVQYLSKMLNVKKNEGAKDDFEENYINRFAIILKPQQPFIDWYSNLHPEDVYKEEIKETNIYLINDEIDDVEKWLRKKFDKFFIMELDVWHNNKKEWPQKRNYKMFKLWFRIEISDMIYDLEKKPVLKIE